MKKKQQGAAQVIRLLRDTDGLPSAGKTISECRLALLRRISMRLFALATPLLLGSCVAPTTDVFDRLADPEDAPYRIAGTGFVTHSGHPKQPFQFRRQEVEFRLSVHPRLGECEIEFRTGTDGAQEVGRYYIRRGRIFQVDENGKETDPASLGDLCPATLAALHPAIVASAIRERRAAVRLDGSRGLLFGWNDELWTLGIDSRTGNITRVGRRFCDDRLGDGLEEVTYESRSAGRGPGLLATQRVIVTSRGRELARIDFATIDRGVTMDVPAGDRRRDRASVVPVEEIQLTEIAPHLFTIDLQSMNARVMVAEFTDHLVVLEGAYNSQICDSVAAVLRKQLGKPVRYFAFSHLHPQYVGGTRSWVREGATVLLPPTTVPLIEAMVEARHDLRPDALALHPMPLQIEVVEGRRRLEDDTNALEIFNIQSGHTDEYFIFYFPRPKVLMTGDLLWYRAGKPLTGRSKRLCDEVERLKLDVDRFYVTWPLDGFGTKNVVSKDEIRRGREEDL